MAINISVQYNGGFPPDIIQLTLCYCYRLTPTKCHEVFLVLQPLFPPQHFDACFPLLGECSKGLDAFRIFFRRTTALSADVSNVDIGPGFSLKQNLPASNVDTRVEVHSSSFKICFHCPRPIRAREFGLARQVRISRPASACSFSQLRLCSGRQII